MASATRDKYGNGAIQFVGADRKRRTIGVGKLSDTKLEIYRQRIESLRAAQQHGHVLDAETLGWVSRASAELRSKLVDVGLVEPAKAAALLGDWIEKYIAGRTDLSGRSLTNLRIAASHVIGFYGPSKPMESVTPADADAFMIHMRGKGASATAARIVKRARQFWTAAIRAELVRKNPFADIKPGSMANADRQFHVSREAITRVFEECPDTEWRLIVALSRFGGLRCPSETLGLEWNDVAWDKGRFLVRSAKTGNRLVPIFPELLPFLREAFELAEPGAVHAITRYRFTEQNLRTRFLRIIARAGLVPWPKPFHNLRASRETELAETFPLHVVCAWIGNSPAVAAAHYLTVRESDFERAICISSAPTSCVTSMGCVNGDETDENDGQTLKFAPNTQRVQSMQQVNAKMRDADCPDQDSNPSPKPYGLRVLSASAADFLHSEEGQIIASRWQHLPVETKSIMTALALHGDVRATTRTAG